MFLLTGGAGFIGRHLVNRVLELSNEEALVIDKALKPIDFPASKRVVYQKGDAHRTNALVPAESRSHLKIVHLAAETSVRRSTLEPLPTLRTNVGMTCSLLEFARKVDPDSFVFASSAAIYGDKKTPCTESDLPDPCSPYGASKLAAEYYCRVYARLYRIPITILRFFNVYGPGQSSQYAGVITSFLQDVLHGRPPTIYGDGKQTRDFIFVDDVVDAMMKVVRTKPVNADTMNIGTGRPTRIGALALKVLSLLGREDLRPIYTPARKGDIVSSQADITSAIDKIGFRPRVGLDEGLRLTRSWALKEGRFT